MPPAPRFLPDSGYDEVNARQRVGSIVDALREAYPAKRTALRYRTPFQLLVATILSAQCTDETVNRVTPELFRRFGTPRKLAAADPDEVERVIRPTGFFRQKTKAICGSASMIVTEFAGRVPRTMEDLTRLPGVARKTANVVMANCWPHSGHGIFVDTHIRRISQRLALTDQEDPVRIEQHLMELLPPDAWVDVPHALIELGRGPCDARRPLHDDCPLLPWCPTGQLALATAAEPGSPGEKARPPRRAPRRRGRPGASRR
jgi:endonuclease III